MKRIKKDEENEDPVDFVKKVTKLDVTNEDIKDYEDYIDDTVRISSPIYQQCKPALLAMAAYVFENDCDLQFEKWVDDYSNNTYEFSKNMEENYEAMNSAFLRDLEESKVA